MEINNFKLETLSLLSQLKNYIEYQGCIPELKRAHLGSSTWIFNVHI